MSENFRLLTARFMTGVPEKSPTLSDKFKTAGKELLASWSFSHIVEILTVADPLARYFYEQECIKCTWSVRELRFFNGYVS
jgi:hypothetical protein